MAISRKQYEWEMARQQKMALSEWEMARQQKMALSAYQQQLGSLGGLGLAGQMQAYDPPPQQLRPQEPVQPEPNKALLLLGDD